MFKTALVYGFGKSGLHASEMLNRLGCVVRGIDDNDNAKIPPEVIDMRGRELEDIFKDCEALIISPNISLDNKYVSFALNKGIEIIGETELAFRLFEGDIIAITGTNGKTTATYMLTKMLRDVGIDAEALGNCGIPLSSKVFEMKSDTVAVLEVSSFQLETTKSFKPKFAICLNVTPDHLERHIYFEEYTRCKRKLFENCDKNDYAILNYDEETTRSFAEATNAITYYFSLNKKVKGCYLQEGKLYFSEDGEKEEFITYSDKLKLNTLHNLQNSMACLCVMKILAFPNQPLINSIKSFRFPKHRLEKVAKIGKKTFFDDSKATNIDATQKACLSMYGSTALIAGGYDKGLEYASFFKCLPKNIKVVFCVGANRFLMAEQARELSNVIVCDSLESAVKKAFFLDVQNILFSPTTSSFDQYESYAQRGEAFVEVVKGLLNESC